MVDQVWEAAKSSFLNGPATKRGGPFFEAGKKSEKRMTTLVVGVLKKELFAASQTPTCNINCFITTLPILYDEKFC